jgi:hypothetical protein
VDNTPRSRVARRRFAGAIVSVLVGFGVSAPGAGAARITDTFNVLNMSSEPISLVGLSPQFVHAPAVGSSLAPGGVDSYEAPFDPTQNSVFPVEYGVSVNHESDFLQMTMSVSRIDVAASYCFTKLGACQAGDHRIFFFDRPTRALGGTRGSDRLSGTSAGAEVIRGADGDDRLVAGSGNDRLYGGPGDDVLVGGRGRDLLSGGPGADRIIDRRGPAVVLTGTVGRGEWDRVMVRDGRADDTVICGSPRTRVVIDRGDRVLGHCGTVIRSPR